MQTIVIYSSQTGNTRKLATQIFAAIPGDSKDLKNIDEYREKDAELYFCLLYTSPSPRDCS